MIGQSKLLQTLQTYTDAGFPRFCILVGGRGGRRLISMSIAKLLQAQYINVDTKVDAVREAITLSYTQSEPTLYVIADADKMSGAAKNALLKVTEEPPRKAYFLIIISDTSATLETLCSRGMVFNMDLYTPDELLQFAKTKEIKIEKGMEKVVSAVCRTPADVLELCHYSDMQQFYSFAQSVTTDVHTVNVANALKIGTKLRYKDEETDKWSPQLLLQTVCYLYACKAAEDKNNADVYYQLCRCTSRYLSDLKSASVSKPSTIDAWILTLRSIWRRA